MTLSAFLLPGGYDDQAWRLEGSRSEELGTFELMAEITRKFEAAKLDSVFVADVISSKFLLESNVKMGSPYEPMTVLSALASITTHIGLIGTFSTTWNHPFTLARQLAALDILSDGRAGWNIVTSSMAEDNYGTEMPSKEARYHRALEFVGVVKELWSSWSDSAIVNDRERGVWVDPDRIRMLDHEGDHFKVAGCLNIPRSPQGHPVFIQAGQSSGGLNLGAAVADVVYTAQPQRSKAIEYYAEHKLRVMEKGRNPDHVQIIPGISPYIGSTDAEGREYQASIAEFIDYEIARVKFAEQYELDIADIDLDERIPVERFGDKNDDTAGTRFLAYRHLAVEDGYTLRQVLLNVESVGGHLVVAGSASTVADVMIDWYEHRACDGFSLNPPAIPGSIDQICDLLIPELQDRGYFRTEYEETTLRGHLGLPYPESWDVEESTPAVAV
jgi:FMN-dependent oxidoreductase (nitrilotriacetate monooxygenase family)